MREDALYNSFLEEITQKIPQKMEVVNLLADTLCLAREAVYRRLRKEVPFTFQEVMTISRKFGISLDNLKMDDTSPQTSAFRLKLIEYVNPSDSDFTTMREVNAMMDSLKKSGAEGYIGEITGTLPAPLYVKSPYLFRLYLLKWRYQSGRSGPAVPYKDIFISDKLQKNQDDYVACAKSMHVDYVLDPLMMSYLVNSIKYFYYIGLITRQEVMLIRDDISQVMDNVDVMTRTGARPDTGKRINIYISSMNIDTGYIYVSAPGFHLTVIKAFLLNGVASTDKSAFDEVKAWMESMQRQSTLITRSGEKERINFIERESKIADSLLEL